MICFYPFVLCRTLTPGHDAVQKVTLVPRGQARGLTWFIPADDPTLISKQQLFARIVGGLGGRAAEEVIFGEPEVTTGAAGDLQQITGLAKQVTHCLVLSLSVVFRFYLGIYLGASYFNFVANSS
jgi:ATP-dependent Zn protease